MIRWSRRNTRGTPGAEVGCSLGEIWKLVLKTCKFESNSVVLLIHLLQLTKQTNKKKQMRKWDNEIKIRLLSLSLQLNEFTEGSVMCYYIWFSSHKSHVNCLVSLCKNSHCLTCSWHQSLTLILTCLCVPRVFIYCFSDCTLVLLRPNFCWVS